MKTRWLALVLIIGLMPQVHAERLGTGGFILESPILVPNNSGNLIRPQTQPRPRPTNTDPFVLEEPILRPRPGFGNPRVTPSPIDELLEGMLDPNAPPQNASQRQPIWKPFLIRFNACAPGCRPGRYNAPRNSPGSCHSVGRAIDVFSMICNDGRVYRAIDSSRTEGRFAQLVRCMAGPGNGRGVHRNNGFVALWHNGQSRTQGHKDHAHFSIGCFGRRW